MDFLVLALTPATVAAIEKAVVSTVAFNVFSQMARQLSLRRQHCKLIDKQRCWARYLGSTESY